MPDNAHGCRLPLLSNWVSTAPDAYFDASDSIWKGFDVSGIISTGSSVNFCFKVSNDFCASSFQINPLFFWRRVLSGFAISEYLLMNRR